MKKTIIIGFTILLTISIVILFACCGTTLFCGGKHINKSIKITEEIIENKVPEGFIPLNAMETPNRRAVLTDSIYTIVLIENPTTQREEDQEYFLFNTIQNSQNIANGPFKERATIKQDGKLTINGKKYPKFNLITHSLGKELTGTAFFINYPGKNKTVIFICLAETHDHNPDIPIKLLKQILKKQSY